MIGSRLDRYILRELLTPTLLGLSLYTFVLLMNHFFVVAEKSLSKNLSAELTLRLFVVGIPQLLVMTIPMAVLLGTLIAVGRLSADQEWTALQGAGRGPLTLLRPVLLHGLLGSIAAFMIYTFLVPQTHYAFRNIRGEVLVHSNLAADLRPRVFYEFPESQDRVETVLYVDEIRPGGDRRLEGVLAIQSDRQSETSEVILARFGDLYPAAGRTGNLEVDLFQGSYYRFGPRDPDSYFRGPAFGRARRLSIEPPAFIQSLLDPPRKSAQDLSLPELWDELAAAREERSRIDASAPAASGQPRSGMAIVADRRVALATVEWHQRLALPLASLLFALLALPLGITRVRSGKGAGFAISLVVILLYRVVFVLTRNQALESTIPPAIGPWLANAVILAWGLWALFRLNRRSIRGGRGLPGFLDLRGLLERWRTRRRRAAGDESVSPVELSTLSGTSTRFVARLDRYIGLAYLRVLGFAVLSGYLIFGLVEFQRLMDDVLRTQQPLSLVAEYFKYFTPTALHIVLPISCLVGSVVAITMLSRSGEMVAIKASGIGAQRVTLPILLVTLLASCLLFYVDDRIAPTASRKAQAIKDQIQGRAARTHGVPIHGRWSFGPEGRHLYHYRLYDPDRQEFRDLSVFTIDRSAPRILDHRYSELARWSPAGWELERGWYRTFGDDEGTTQFEAIREVDLGGAEGLISPPERLITKTSDLPDVMSLDELQEQIRTLGNSGYDITRLRVAYFGKFSHATAPLVMALLGLPFAFKVGRRGSLYGIGVALLLVLVYWATFAIFEALGLETLLRPIAAALAPNALFALVGSYLMLYVRT